jgi:hypothetical protein
MKTLYKNIFIIIVAPLIMSSCNYLDVVPDNVPTIDHAFADRFEAIKFLGTCYWGLPKSAGWNENPAVFGAMEIIFNKERATTGGFQAALGNDSPTAARINYWGGTGTYIRSLYAGINNCNTFLENIGNVQDLNAYEKRRWIAEVTLIKAFMHFFLTTYYGPMCPLKENLPVGESTANIRVYRQKIDDCFAYIFELIDEVIDSDALPLYIDNYTTELGRFTKAAAYMLKAKALLYWASPLFNGNTDYNSFKNENGEHFFNQTYDPTRWQQAANACLKAIEVCQTSGIRLYQMDDYVQPKQISDSTRLVNMLRSVVTDRYNCELIWGNTAYPASGGNTQGPCLFRLERLQTQGFESAIYSVPLHIVDKFYSKNGVPIEEDITYPYTERFNIRTGDFEHRFYIEQGQQTAEMNFDREPRFYSSMGFDRGKWWGNAYNNEPENDAQCLHVENRFNEYSSVFNPGTYNATGYAPKKLVGFKTQVINQNGSFTAETYPFPDMRYADLLLFCAEALNETKTAPDAEVYQLVDAVRKRAGLEGVVDSWRKYSVNSSKPLTKEGMREIIRRERANEFAFEGPFFWDSHRWKTAVAEQNRPIQGWNVQESELQDYYTVTSYYTQKFTYRDYFAPIPEGDIINNPLLIQNPGW